MTAAIVFSVISIIIVTVLTFWVTKKAYSKKWDEE